MMSSPKVLLFMTWDVSLALWKEKGLFERELKLYEFLGDKGVHVTILSWGGQEDADISKAISHPNIDVISAYNFIPRPKNKAVRALYSCLVPFKIKAHIKHADVLKTNQMWGGWVAALSSLLFKKPLIARCGYELHDFTKKQGHRKLRQYFIWGISKFTYVTAKHICVATSDDKKHVMTYFKQPSDKITLHPNWIDVNRFAPIEGIKEKRNHILFVGRLTEQKNLPLLIGAMKGSEITLDIIGDGELKDRLQVNGARVNFLGKHPNDKLPALYNSYPVYVLSSHYEGNPKTLLEAMSCGRAVIGTNVPGISSVIQHERSGLLCEPEKDDLRKAIERVLQYEDLRKSLGQAARQQIIETQSLDTLVDKEVTLYERVMQK